MGSVVNLWDCKSMGTVNDRKILLKEEKSMYLVIDTIEARKIVLREYYFKKLNDSLKDKLVNVRMCTYIQTKILASQHRYSHPVTETDIQK